MQLAQLMQKSENIASGVARGIKRATPHLTTFWEGQNCSPPRASITHAKQYTPPLFHQTGLLRCVFASWISLFSIADNYPVLIRWLSLVVLIFQTSAFVLVMRYSRTRPGDLYISTTAVVMAEATKLTFCLAVTFCEHHCNIFSWLQYLNEVSC